MALPAGTRLGPYEIIAPLGAGAMGEVYRARDERLSRDVAIKVLPSWAAADPEMLRRFEVEARAAGGLSHPGIVSIHDIGHSAFGPFIVSELLEGETLRQRLQRGPLGAAETIDLGRQAAHALAAAHEHGIVHRDLKPENLFVTSDGRLKILDFGIARLMPDASSRPTTAATAATVPGLVLGTYGYMSPEQATGHPADHRSDIFSLGAVLYEMLSGRQAFPGTTHIEIANAVVRHHPPVLTGVDPGLEQVVRRCLEKEGANRFESARDLAVALQTAAGSGARTAVTIAAAPSIRRRRGLVLGGAALILLVVLAVFGARRFELGAGDRSPITSLAVLPPPHYSDKSDDAYFADSMTEAMIGDLARIGSLTVKSRTSVMRFKGTDKSARQIAKELGVQALVETSIFKTGNRIRITATLVDARTDRPLWSDTYERDMHDVLALQSTVARAISKKISATITPLEQQYFDEARVVDPAAHDAYFRGRYEWNRYSLEGFTKALGHFQEAIRIDKNSARAYAGLADTYSAMRYAYARPETVMPKAKEAALKAVELDESLAEARVALGLVLTNYDWDFPAAEEEFKRAIALNRNLASAHDGYAMLLAALGRHAEASAEMERALLLDPLSPPLRVDAAWINYLSRRYDLVVEQGQKSIDLDSQFWAGYTMIGLGYEKLGKFTDALRALQTARSMNDNPMILEMLGGLYATMGKTAEAHAILAELEAQAKSRYVCAYEVATIHAGLGARRATMDWLEKGRRERADCMPWIASDPKLERMHDDPEFQTLLHGSGFRPHAAPGVPTKPKVTEKD